MNKKNKIKLLITICVFVVVVFGSLIYVLNSYKSPKNYNNKLEKFMEYNIQRGD